MACIFSRVRGRPARSGASGFRVVGRLEDWAFGGRGRFGAGLALGFIMSCYTGQSPHCCQLKTIGKLNRSRPKSKPAKKIGNDLGASRHCPRSAAFRPLQCPTGMDERIELRASER